MSVRRGTSSAGTASRRLGRRRLVEITGNDALFTAPHQGFIAAQNGRYLETDLPDGTATVDVATGHFDTGFDSALCAALS